MKLVYSWAEIWRRVWGTQKNFSRTFQETMSIFTPKNSDDLFLVIDQVFLISTLSFRFSVSLLYQMSYMTLSSQQKALFQQENSLATPIFSSLQAFAPIPQHYFSKLGDRPPGPPLGLRPCSPGTLKSCCRCCKDTFGRMRSFRTHWLSLAYQERTGPHLARDQETLI